MQNFVQKTGLNRIDNILIVDNLPFVKIEQQLNERYCAFGLDRFLFNNPKPPIFYRESYLANILAVVFKLPCDFLKLFK